MNLLICDWWLGSSWKEEECFDQGLTCGFYLMVGVHPKWLLGVVLYATVVYASMNTGVLFQPRVKISGPSKRFI